MKITIIGSGYVGLVTGACLAELGNQVLCLDVDTQKIALLNAGEVPIYEPGLEMLLERNKKAGRIAFTTDIEQSVAHGDLQFIAVGTPPDADSRADLQFVLSAGKNIAKYMTSFKVIINKSTVPVGTADKVDSAVMQILNERGLATEYSVVSNPEFLKEGAAIDDFMRPDRIVIGTKEDENGLRARELMRNLYAPFNRNHERTYYMDIRSAELTKYAANAMLATRISFMNELANLADEIGADIEKVRTGIGSDTRIGHSFLYAGTGYGGSCFPKDVNALIMTGADHGKHLKLLEAVHSVNEKQKSVLVDKIISNCGPNLNGMKIAIWGLAFKPNTDDMRDAPSRVVIKRLIELGAAIQAHDPVAMKEAKLSFATDLNIEADLNKISYFDNPEDALTNADFLVILTEWKVYRSPDFEYLVKTLKKPLIFDGRNLYEPKQMKKIGIEYHAIGRST
jgi:UDPglucose 6-dehydrogenase